jgi:hypothetical protein
MPGRALLIGASDYGQGFVPLPAARQDVDVMRRALEARGYEVQIAPASIVANAADLDRTIRAFCRSTGDDVSIVYFSGHGMSIEEHDWIIPEGVSRIDATESANQRVSTDLTRSVDQSRSGLVLFIIDACRDPEDDSITKGVHTWSRGRVDSREGRFIRFFGCSTGQVCHVLRKWQDGQDVSVFTAALGRALAPDARNETLQDVLDAVVKECQQISVTARPSLPRQEPCFDIAGDISSQGLQLLKKAIFWYPSIGVGGSHEAVWAKFEPRRLHGIIVESEHATHDLPSVEQLRHKVADAFLRKGAAIWGSFREFWNERRLIDSSMRMVQEKFDPTNVALPVVPVTQAFRSREALEEVVTAVVQADLAFFDVTHFEPAVMFLLGVRAASKRGVTLCSHGFGWREGQKLDTPFNLSDLQVFSHSDTDAPGEDPVVGRLVEGICRGFGQLARQPRYLDLPAYDSLRELGPEIQSWETVDWNELVLALCSFRPEHREAWRYVRRGFEKALQERGAQSPHFQRLIDLGSSQLVSQALYEHIRRVAACVMDWSHFSPSSFLELGVRLAVSPWGVLQIVEEGYLTGRDKALHIEKPDGSRGPELKQVALMTQQFRPEPYRTGADRSFRSWVDALVDRRPFDEEEPDYNWLHRVVQRAIEPVSTSSPPVHVALSRTAESLSNSKQERLESSQILFGASRGMKQDRERAALEHRIAAWLYLEHRMKAGGPAADDSLRKMHRELGQLTAGALYDSDAEGDFELAELITSTLSARKTS